MSGSKQSKISSPARSQSLLMPPIRQNRRSNSVCSAKSNSSLRLSNLVQHLKDGDFVLSPQNSRRSVLSDNTTIEHPRRKSWWKNLRDNSRDVLEALDTNKMDVNNVIQEYADIEVPSQENREYSLDLPESSDGESIVSIIVPQRKLFPQKESQPKTQFEHLTDTHESSTTKNKISTEEHENSLTVPPKNLFNQGPKRARPAFPKDLLQWSLNKTVNKTIEVTDKEVQGEVRNLFGNKSKRKNIFADFVLSESDDDISEIQPRFFGFQKKFDPKRRRSSVNRREGENSPTSSITTDIEMDDWEMLPSSTMVEMHKVNVDDDSDQTVTNIELVQGNKENNWENEISRKAAALSQSKTRDLAVSKSLEKSKNQIETTIVETDIQDNENTLQNNIQSDNIEDLQNIRNEEEDQITETPDEDVVHNKSKSDHLKKSVNKVQRNKSADHQLNKSKTDIRNKEYSQDIVASEIVVSKNVSGKEIHLETEKAAISNNKENTLKEQNTAVDVHDKEKNIFDDVGYILDDNEQKELITNDDIEIAIDKDDDTNIEEEKQNTTNEEDLNNVSGLNADDLEAENEQITNDDEDNNDSKEENIEVERTEFDNEEANLNVTDDETSENDQNVTAEEQMVTDDEISENDQNITIEEPIVTDNEISENDQNVTAEEQMVTDEEENNCNDDEEYEHNVSHDEIENVQDTTNEDNDDQEESDNDHSDEIELRMSTDDEIEECGDDNEQGEQNQSIKQDENEIASKSTQERELQQVLSHVSHHNNTFEENAPTDTNARKTKSVIKNRTIRPSLVPARESIEFIDGTANSTAEGSGWDSHRTTRKTLRQTFGKDFTPRKSLRAMVMEKSAKRQTVDLEANSVRNKPPANSTELPEVSMPGGIDAEISEVPQHEESDHEESRAMRQATLKMYLEKIKMANRETRLQIEKKVQESLKRPPKPSDPFKLPLHVNIDRVKKPTEKKPKRKPKSYIPLECLPKQLLEDMKYKPPKRFQPKQAPWATKRLYTYLESKLEPKFDYKARVRAEELVKTLFEFTKFVNRREVAPQDAIDDLKREMATCRIVRRHHEFYQFFHDFMPGDVRRKVNPDLVNQLPLPKNGIFGEILQENERHSTRH